MAIYATYSDTGTGDLLISAANAKLRLCGFFIGSTIGTTTTIIREGIDDTGTAAIAIKRTVNTGLTFWAPEGIAMPGGIFLDRTAQTSTCVVYWTID